MIKKYRNCRTKFNKKMKSFNNQMTKLIYNNLNLIMTIKFYKKLKKKINYYRKINKRCKKLLMNKNNK